MTVYSNRVILLIRICCFTLFIGRAYQHFFLDVPITELLWDSNLMEGFVNNVLGMTWFEYATDLRVSVIFVNIKKSMGVIYLVSAVLSLIASKKYPWMKYFFLFSSGLLLFLVLLYAKAKFFHIGQFIEYSSQVATPIVLYLIIYKELESKKLLLFLKIIILLTFLGHGMYAIGYYSRPGHFVDMVINVFGVQESFAQNFILTAGIFDMLVCVTIFIPRIEREALFHAAFWGFITAFARVASGINFDLFWYTFKQCWHETVYRLPHGLIPVLAILVLYQIKKKKNNLNHN